MTPFSYGATLKVQNLLSLESKFSPLIVALFDKGFTYCGNIYCFLKAICLLQMVARPRRKSMFLSYIPFTVVSMSTQCPTEWHRHEEYCYRVFDQRATYDNTLSACAAHQGSLVIIPDSTVNGFLKTLTERYTHIMMFFKSFRVSLFFFFFFGYLNPTRDGNVQFAII